MARLKMIHVLLLLSLSVTVCGSFEEGLMDCEIEDKSMFLECRDSSGKSIPINDNLMPSNSTCLQVVDEKYIPVQCYDGVFIQSFTEGSSVQSRTKRFDSSYLLLLFPPFGWFACIFVCGRGGPPKNPPTVSQKVILITSLPIYADRRKDTATVRWKATQFNDQVKAKLDLELTQNKKSGDKFSVGTHNVIYTGTNDGLIKTDSLRFEVKVYRCKRPRWPLNGELSCDLPDNRDGTECTVKCFDGYKLKGAATLTCERLKGGWSRRVPDCKPKACEAAPPIPHGSVKCSGEMLYRTICEAVCNNGYQVEGKRMMMCDKDGKWGSVPTCKDVTPPHFDPGTCPRDKQVNIDAPNNTAKVTWEIPKGMDNSGEAPFVTETHGYISGQRFTAGSQTVSYTIKDKVGNQGSSCRFTIQVLTVSCSPPLLNVFGGEHLDYMCPDAYMLGATCNLACKSGYPMGGATQIQCLKKPDISPPEYDWTWSNGSLAPFCKETNCSMAVLNSPENGALSCSEWTHGQMCQMQCQKGYDIPNVGDGMFVCGRSTGKWRPSANVPDCHVQKDVTRMNLPNEFFYYTGKCNSSAQNLHQIKENFIQALSTSKFLEECVGVPECQAQFVGVTCGPTASRRKRSISRDNRSRRATQGNAYRIQFNLVLPFAIEEGKSADDIFAANEEKFYKMSDYIQAEVDSGHFDLNIADLHVDVDSYGPGNPKMSCPNGTQPRLEAGTCVGCPKGQFSDRGRCTDCPVGEYQNETNSLSCLPCPAGRNTTETGATSVEQCLEYCPEGEYSPTGLSPCTKCASDSYQSEAKSTTCTKCEIDTRAKINGAISKSQCIAFDIGISETDVLTAKNKQENDISSVYMWIFVRNSTTNNAAFQVTTPEDDNVFTLLFAPFAKVIVSGHEMLLNESIPQSTWTNVAINLHKQSGKLQVYIDGKLTLDNDTLGFSKINSSGFLEVVKFHGGLTLSGFKVLPRALTVSEISTWSSTCTLTMSNVSLTMDSLANAENTTINIPSVCDPINDCDSSPCANHECIDKAGDYECRCSDGYSGRQCETPPDFCEDNSCTNGATCVRGTNNYTCDCSYGFRGSFCEVKAVDGQWSEWTKWSICSQSCGGGNQTRIRKCDSPPADTEGKPCVGDSSVTKICNEDVCPVCSRLRRTYGLQISCNETADVRRCALSCRTGLYFSEEPLPYYECGFLTGYKWNHQNEHNPTGRLPSCSEFQPPPQLSVSFQGSYDTIPCTADGIAGAKRALETKLSSIDCKAAGECTATVHDPECSAERKKRDVGGTLKLTIELHADVNASKDSFNNIESAMQNKSALSNDLINFAKLTMELENSAQKIFNNSVNFFQLTIDGTDHSLAPGSNVTFEKDIGCPSGTVPVKIVCMECPVGSYCDGNRVTMCPRGQFQDEESQSVCKPCPSGNTTQGVGSIYLSECSVPVVSREKDNRDVDNGDDEVDIGVKIAVGTSVSIALLSLTAVCVVFVIKYNKVRTRKIDIGSVELYSMSENVTSGQTKPVFDKGMLRSTNDDM